LHNVRLKLFSLAGLALLLKINQVFGAVPVLDHLFPIAAQTGTTNTVTAIGKFDPWPPKVWVDAPGIVFQPETNSGKFSVEIAADAPVGPHLVRLFNEEGSGGPRFLIVTREPQLVEAEPNDDFRKPQVPEHFPASINGRLEKSGDVDSFAVELEAGQTLVAAVEAFTLASPVDAVLRVLDARGIQVAFNHDGATLDPFLVWTARSAGTYVVQLFGFAYPAESEVKFTGNNKCVYRLQLSRGPCLRHTLPLGVQRGVRTALQARGWNLQRQMAVPFDGSDLSAEISRATLRLPGFDNEISLPVGGGPELLEQKMNEHGSESNCVAVPFAITGCIEKAGEEDRFRFAVTKDEKLLIEVQSASFGFPLDAWLKVENLKGKELAKNDDSAGPDPKLEWTASEDGTFVLAVGNVLHRGGLDYLYRLSVQLAVSALKISVSETTLSIAPGKTNEVKITAKRLHGFKAKATLSMKDLPDNLDVEPVEVSEKGGEVTLKLVAASDAKPFSGPIQIVATEVESGRVHRATADLTSSTVNNGVPGGFGRLVIESTDQLWLTVLRAPEQKPEKPK
jgi:hypothetical protein